MKRIVCIALILLSGATAGMSSEADTTRHSLTWGAISDSCIAVRVLREWQPTDYSKIPGVYTVTVAVCTTYIPAGRTEKGEQLYRAKMDTTVTWVPQRKYEPGPTITLPADIIPLGGVD